MSKKKLLKDNLLMFIGGNIANAVSYLLNVLLSRSDEKLFNLYTAYTSVSLLLLVPSLVTMRVFTVFGNPILLNIRNFYLKYQNKVLGALIVFVLALIPLNIFLTKATVEGTFYTSLLLIILAITGFVGNIFRGIRQNQEDYKIAVLSINIEAISRLIIGFLLAEILGMGISGILIGHIIGFAGSLLVCFDWKKIKSPVSHDDEVRLSDIFLKTFIMTAGLEFFSNFDIIYSNYILQENHQQQTEFNTLQFLRKIIFFGIFTLSSVILSMGGKNKHTKKFMFSLTLGIGFTVGIVLGSVFFALRGIIFEILKKEVTLITAQDQIFFLLATTLMSTSYLMANWLFTMKKKIFISVPVIASIIQAFVFFVYATNLRSVLNAFYIASILFFMIAFGAGLIETLKYPDSTAIEEPELAV